MTMEGIDLHNWCLQAEIKGFGRRFQVADADRNSSGSETICGSKEQIRLVVANLFKQSWGLVD